MAIKISYDFSNLTAQQQESLWKSLLGKSYPYSNKPFNSPLRKDDNPSCVILRNTPERIVMYDYFEKKGYTLLEYIAAKHNVSKTKAANIFNKLLNDDNYVSDSNGIYKRSTTNYSKYIIDCEPLDLTKYQLFKPTKEYLDSYGITVYNLITDNVQIPLKIVTGSITYTPRQVAFIFNFPSGNKKLYQPFSLTDKWKSTVNNQDYWFIDNKSNVLFIGSSWKDIRVVSNVLDNKIDCIAFQNEAITTLPIGFLEQVNNYDRIVVAGDFDAAGQTFNTDMVELIKPYCNNTISLDVNVNDYGYLNSYNKAVKDFAELYRDDINKLKELICTII